MSEQFPEGFEWSEEEGRPVYRGDEGRFPSPSDAQMALSVAESVLGEVGPFLAQVDDPAAEALARAVAYARELCLRALHREVPA